MKKNGKKYGLGYSMSVTIRIVLVRLYHRDSYWQDSPQPLTGRGVYKLNRKPSQNWPPSRRFLCLRKIVGLSKPFVMDFGGHRERCQLFPRAISLHWANRLCPHHQPWSEKLPLKDFSSRQMLNQHVQWNWPFLDLSMWVFIWFHHFDEKLMSLESTATSCHRK